MATIYKVEVVSHWMNYPKEDIEKKIKKALEEHDNTVQVKVTEKR